MPHVPLDRNTVRFRAWAWFLAVHSAGARMNPLHLLLASDIQNRAEKPLLSRKLLNLHRQVPSAARTCISTYAAASAELRNNSKNWAVQSTI